MEESLTRRAAQPTEPAQTPAFDFEKLKGRPNLDQTRLGSSGRWSLEKLLALTQAEGIELWHQLSAPALAEMNGHYMGMRPNGLNEPLQREYAAYMYDENSPRGYWLGKGFRPLTDTTGEGYNRWRFPSGRIARNLRMTTRIGPSLVDDRPCFILDYPALNPELTMIDEIRKLDDSVYFGVLTRDAGGVTRDGPDFFFLVGPTDEWVGPSEAG